MTNHQKSTYALLVGSEERSRTALETVAYTAFMLSVIVAIWQFAQQPVNVPAIGIQSGVANVIEIAAANSPS